MRVFLSLFFACVTAPLWAAPVQVTNVRIWAAPDNTRVVLDMSGPAEHKVTMLTDPFRAVIDIQDARLKSSLSANPKSNDRYLQDIRTGIHDDDLRVVLDLKKFATANTFLLPPNDRYGNRLVIDLSNNKPDQDATPDVAMDEGRWARRVEDAGDFVEHSPDSRHGVGGEQAADGFFAVEVLD